MVRYQGSNGQRLHAHMLRAFPGGVAGFALKAATGSRRDSDSRHLSKALTDYLRTPKNVRSATRSVL